MTLGLAFQGVASKLCFVTSLSSNDDFGGWECAQNVPKSFQTCGSWKDEVGDPEPFALANVQPPAPQKMLGACSEMLLRAWSVRFGVRCDPHWCDTTDVERKMRGTSVR